MWCIGVEVKQETSAPPPKKNPGSAPAPLEKHPLADYYLFGGDVFEWSPSTDIYLLGKT